MKIGIVGAGLSGAVIAQQLANAGHQIDVFESSDNVGGMCHTERVDGILIHCHGPHIFHTDNQKVWDYVNEFATFRPFVLRTKNVSDNLVYSFPINLHTINQYFGRNFTPALAKAFLESQALHIKEPKNLEEQAIKLIGYDLYKAFIEGYTWKQWGVDPKTLSPDIIKRLPVRFNYDDNYFYHQYQGIPEEGYTAMIENILDHPNIHVYVNEIADSTIDKMYDHVFWSGTLDSFFRYDFGRLGYRTLEFHRQKYKGDYQGAPVVNYASKHVPWTRIVEHKHFAPHEEHTHTIIHKEYSKFCEPGDAPYYPLNFEEDKRKKAVYMKRAKAIKNVTFIGRLGKYQYIDMDVTIKQALDIADEFMLTSVA